MSEANSTTQSGVRQIPLTQGMVALVDEDDFERVNQHRWYASRNRNGFYVRRSDGPSRNIKIYLHRFILDAPVGMHVDHVNGNGLDNRRCNLRLCTNAQNQRNQRKRPGTSKYKGVHWDKSTRKWRASITVDYRSIILGYFDSEEVAYAAYCGASSKYHGSFGRIA